MDNLVHSRDETVHANILTYLRTYSLTHWLTCDEPVHVNIRIHESMLVILYVVSRFQAPTALLARFASPGRIAPFWCIQPTGGPPLLPSQGWYSSWDDQQWLWLIKHPTQLLGSRNLGYALHITTRMLSQCFLCQHAPMRPMRKKLRREHEKEHWLEHCWSFSLQNRLAFWTSRSMIDRSASPRLAGAFRGHCPSIRARRMHILDLQQ